jgi:hypothetical protein
MAPRLSVLLAVGAVACASLTGCRDAEPVAPAATPSQYISAVQDLLDAPGRLASTISQATDPDPPPAPSRRRLRDLIDGARARLAEFRALRLDDPALRRQRDRLAGAYARLIPRMQAAADALPSGDRSTIARASGPFLDSLRTLPSDAASSPSR